MLHEDIYSQILAEYILIAELVIFVLIGLAWYYADQKQFDHHKLVVQIMIFGQVFLTTVMILRIYFSTYAQQFIIHASMGIFVFGLIIYTYLLMTERIPKFLAIPTKYRKNLMRITAILWALGVISGILSFMFIPE